MPTRVLACVLRKSDRLLLCRRALHKRHGGLWEFPGGKVEPGERNLEAARRELREELDLDVTAVEEVMLSVADPGSQFLIEFLGATAEGEPRCLEHEEFAWVLPEDLLLYELAPSDRRFAEWLTSQADGDVGLPAAHHKPSAQ